MIRAVIFDLDGTLVDHAGAAATALRLGLARSGVAASVAASDATLGRWQRLERTHMDEYLAGECSFADQRRRRLATFLPEVGVAVPDEAANDEFWRQYSLDYEAAWTCYPDVVPCLDRLAAARPTLQLGVLTNGDGSQQRAKLEKFDLLERFGAVCVSTEIGAAKPDARSFAIACERLDVVPGEALFVGDMLALDAEAAMAAGLIGVWLDRPDSADRPPVLRVTTLAQIPGLASAG